MSLFETIEPYLTNSQKVAWAEYSSTTKYANSMRCSAPEHQTQLLNEKLARCLYNAATLEDPLHEKVIKALEPYE